MISLVFCLVLAAVVGVIALATSRNKKTHGVSVIMFFLATSLVAIGVASYPVCELWWSQYQIDIEANRTQAELERANRMISVLGSAENYIHYLKEIKK